MWRYALLGIAIVMAVIWGFGLIDVGEIDSVSANAVIAAPSTDLSGFQRAIDPYDWQFPRDHGAHPAFQTEWWYFTGNLKTEDGRHFGYEFTIFRRAIRPPSEASNSEWRSDQIYMGHFAVTDVQSNAFYEQQRLSRDGAGLAGVKATPRVQIWLENWQLMALDEEARGWRLIADAGGHAIDIQLELAKPLVLQGDNGLSPKSGEEGNASYYYSMTRLMTAGTVRIGDEQYPVRGSSWMDHEFSTSALSDDAIGWDWFGLQFDDGREIMLGLIRSKDGGILPYANGVLVQEDGTPLFLAADDYTIKATGSWQSPHTDAVYPAGWEISINHPEVNLQFTITPLIADQELTQGGIIYWEGAVSISGDVTGYGYVELTGYTESMAGRF